MKYLPEGAAQKIAKLREMNEAIGGKLAGVNVRREQLRSDIAELRHSLSDSRMTDQLRPQFQERLDSQLRELATFDRKYLVLGEDRQHLLKFIDKLEEFLNRQAYAVPGVRQPIISQMSHVIDNIERTSGGAK